MAMLRFMGVDVDQLQMIEDHVEEKKTGKGLDYEPLIEGLV